MTDIDFDELDRAVNSAIGGDQPVVAATPVAAVASTSTPISVSVNTPKPQISIPERRSSSGKFMDVVPPSVNTKVNISTPEVISREAVTVAPTTEVVEEVNPPVVPAPGAGVPEDPIENQWPDPIDFQGLKKPDEESKPAENTDSEDADIDRISDDINKTLEVSSEPLDTPFLADAKVEKRPLGAFSGNPEPPTATPETVDVKIEDNLTTEKTADVEMPEMPELPEETALSEIEQPEESSIAIEEPPVQAAVVSQPTVETAPTPVAPTPVAGATSAPMEQPTSPTSITQQYREQPSTAASQTSGAIYDTDAYHKALKPVKSKSSWWMVLWIFLLLAIGAGAGAAAYFFILPILGL